jgi:hypothetical protein
MGGVVRGDIGLAPSITESTGHLVRLGTLFPALILREAIEANAESQLASLMEHHRGTTFAFGT